MNDKRQMTPPISQCIKIAVQNTRIFLFSFNIPSLFAKHTLSAEKIINWR